MFLQELLVESQETLLADIKKILKGSWRLSPVAAVGALVGAIKPQTVEDIKRGDMFAYAIVDSYFGQHSLPVKEMMSILQKYANKPYTHPFIKAYYELTDKEKSQIESKYTEYHKNKTKFYTLTQMNISVPASRGVPQKPSEPVKPGDRNRPDIMDPPKDDPSTLPDSDDEDDYTSFMDDTEEILGQRYYDFSKKVSPEEIEEYFKNVTVVDVDYDVFDWNLRLLAKLKMVDPVNNLDDPILQLGIMGDPKQMEKGIQNKRQRDKYGKRKVIARFAGSGGIWGAAYGGPEGQDTIIANADQLLGYHPARAVRTDAHEIRHRAWNLISLIPGIRDRLPADLKPGGKWWGSYGARKYMDFDKIDFADGAWAEHALIYAIDYASGVIPERRKGFFDNEIFNTDDYPVSYWKDLYYKSMKAVGDWFKEIGAEDKFIKPKPLNYFNRPPFPGDNLEISNSFAPYIKFNPGLPELYRYLITSNQIETLDAVDEAFKGNGISDWLDRSGTSYEILTAMDAIVLPTERLLFNGNFTAAATEVFPKALADLKKLNDEVGPRTAIKNEIEKIERTIAELNKFKNIEKLNPTYFAEQVANGSIKPATNYEIRKIMPYTIADYRDYKSQLSLGASPLPGVQPTEVPTSDDYSVYSPGDYLKPKPSVYKDIKIPTFVYGTNVSTSEASIAVAVQMVIGYLLGIVKSLDPAIPWPGFYDMDQTIEFYNEYFSREPWSYAMLEPGMPKQITSDYIAQIKEAYEDAQNGKDPEFTGIDSVPAPDPSEPEPESTPEPQDEPVVEPEPQDEPVEEPDEKEPTGDINSSEISPIAYYANGNKIEEGWLAFTATSSTLVRILTGRKSIAYEIWEDNMDPWPGNFNINAAVNFYNKHLSDNPEDYIDRDLPKRINDELKQKLIQKYQDIKNKGVDT